MSSVLFDEKPIVISRELAKVIGLAESIIIQQLHYWIILNKKTNKNNYDGKHWVYRTYEDWQKNDFPFWSASTIKRIFQKIEKENLIITGNFNKKGYDKTKWYTINYEKIETLFMEINNKPTDEIVRPWGQNDPSIGSNRSDRSDQFDPTYTRDYKEINKDINKKKKNKKKSKKDLKISYFQDYIKKNDVTPKMLKCINYFLKNKEPTKESLKYMPFRGLYKSWLSYEESYRGKDTGT